MSKTRDVLPIGSTTFLRLQQSSDDQSGNHAVFFFLRQDPLDLSFWSFLTFLHHGIEEVETHLLWKFHKKIQRKSWSNVPPKLLALRFLYKLKLYTKSAVSESSIVLGRLNLTFWTIFMKLGTLVHHVHGYKTLPHFFLIFALGYGLSKSKIRGKNITKLWKIITKSATEFFVFQQSFYWTRLLEDEELCCWM